MSGRIIISGRERQLKPYISFLLSLLFTGAGEFYAGSLHRGIILAVIRPSSILSVLLYSVMNSRDSYLTEIFAAIIFFTAVTLLSPVHSAVISVRKKRVVVKKSGSLLSILLFIIISTIVTLLSAVIFFTGFSIKRIPGDCKPLFHKGDIVAVKKWPVRLFNKGDMVLQSGGDIYPLRIIALPGEKVSYTKGRFTVSGSDLTQSVLSESEFNALSLNNFDVISESDGRLTYPVIQNEGKFSSEAVLDIDEYYAVPDERNETVRFIKLKPEQISGRVEGILFSPSRARPIIKTFMNR